MQTQDFDFTLPTELIALRPAEPRGSARLLVVYADGRLEHRNFDEIPNFLRENDILSFNDSRVIPARLTGLRKARESGPDIEVGVTLHKRVEEDRYLAFAQPARRLRRGDNLAFGIALTAQVAARNGAEVELLFNQSGVALDRAIAGVGVIPLPPYIASKRPADARDSVDYQTVYAAQDGSVAAPTAGLHFTPQMLQRLAAAGIGWAPITLHVGAGTFLPVAVEDTDEHRMHAEYAEVDSTTAEALNQAHAHGGRIVAVGTTALRTLETATGLDGTVHPFAGDTDIFITPGYRFRAVDVLLTNFHLPRSTLFMLVSAFMGVETMQAAYAEAIRQSYRFYSYGDACLLLRRR